jgi:drug/metabolite transporter (DMT)-like permease
VNKKGLILVFFTAIISGFSIFINKYGVSVINPYIFTFLKNVSVALMLSGCILAFKEWKVLKTLSKKHWSLLFCIGLIGGGAAFLLFFKGLSLTSASQGSLIHKTMFIYVILIAAFFLKERIKKEMLIGALLLLLGNLLALKSLNISFGRGDLYVLAATFLWAIENVISKYALRDLAGRTVAWGRMFFGSLFILGYLFLSGQVSLIANLNYEQIIWVSITSALLFGYVMSWYSGLKYVSVSVATAILLLGSPITIFLAFSSSGKINFGEIVSSGLIISGLAMILGFKYILEQIKRLKEKINVRA